MARYKVPQDVEAEDRLLGPFTFRQFIYLIVSVASLAACWGLFQLFPLLGLIPLPVAILFGALALPLKKDQPMETYLVAIISFHLKNRTRIWTPGQKESTILITAPKIVEKPRTRNITEEEAGRRLSFLADLIDTEGYSIKNSSSVREEYTMEANSIVDMMDSSTGSVFDQMIIKEQNARHAQIVSQMRNVIENQSQTPPKVQHNQNRTINPNSNYNIPNYQPQINYAQSQQLPVHLQNPQQPYYTQQSTQPQFYNQQPQPYQNQIPNPAPQSPHFHNQSPQSYINQSYYQPTPPQTNTQPYQPRPNLTNLANNSVYSVETIQKEANRIQTQGNNNESFISLH